MRRAVEEVMVAPGGSIRDVLACIDRNQAGIALVVDEERRLLATITDGDVRRAMLAGLDVEAGVASILDAQRQRQQASPVTATQGTPAASLLELMDRHGVRQIPNLDPAGRVVDLVLLDDLVKSPGPPVRAVVMAGGLGTRLGSLTADTPKPMLPVGDRPLLERIIAQLRDAGIRRVNLTTHFRAEDIAAHFGDGSRFGVEIRYVNEDTPLGTAGSLGLLEDGDEPLLVMNGDIVTGIDFAAMHRFHDEHASDMTVALQPYEVRVPYGVVEIEDELVCRLAEKPSFRLFVNAGIYLLNRDVSRLVPAGMPYDMTDLIARLVAERRRVVGFPLREHWLDIGTPQDYEQAMLDTDR